MKQHRVWMIVCVLSMIGCATAICVAQGNPHIPTEEELSKQLTGVHADGERGYQERGVETAQSWVHGAIAWVSRTLSLIHLTPASLALCLGAVGIIYTFGKNKHKVTWMVLTVTSFLLAIFGAAAMYFHWPYVS